MQDKRIVTMKSRFSTAVCLLDSYTSQPPLPSANVHVEIAGILKKPIRKANGYYIFTDMEYGRYIIHITSRDYIEETQEINIHPDHGIVNIALNPRPSYPFPAGSTLVRASLKNESGDPIAYAKLTAFVQSDGCIRAKLNQDASAGSREINLAQMTGRICPGDSFLINDTFLMNESDTLEAELISIGEVMESKRLFKLQDGLNYPHSRGASLSPVVHSISSERGEIVLAFPNYHSKSFNISLHITHHNQVITLTSQVDEGCTTNLGIIPYISKSLPSDLL